MPERRPGRLSGNCVVVTTTQLPLNLQHLKSELCRADLQCLEEFVAILWHVCQTAAWERSLDEDSVNARTTCGKAIVQATILLSKCAKERRTIEISQRKHKVRLSARLHLANILLVLRRHTFGGHEWQGTGERVVARGHPTGGLDTTSARAVVKVALLREAHALPRPCGEKDICK